MRIFVPKRDEVTGGWKNCIMRSFVNYALDQGLLEYQAKEDEMDRVCSTQGYEEWI
jgi:hypothetical protein